MRALHTRSDVGVKSKKKHKKVLKYTAQGFVGVVIFLSGVGFGSGSFRLQSFSSVEGNKDLPNTLDYSSVNTIYKSLKNNFDGELKEEDLINGLKKGLASSTGDPYTEYFNVEEAEEFNNGLEGAFEGIGAELGKDEAKNIIVIAPLSGYPAEKAGLKAKDIIAEINGKSAYDISVNEAVQQIRGEAGTEVTLTIVRGSELKEFKIQRQKISVPSVTGEVRDGVGIIKIIRFGEDTFTLTKQKAQEFKEQNVKGIVLDMRNNPGGYLDAAVNVSSLWLDNKTVLTERRGGVVVETLKSRGQPILGGLKTVVLINGGSASASEITAGALKDNGAATLMGEKSFGKGSVQQPVNLSDGGLLKITIARWYTPAGKNIDKEGVKPDIEVRPGENDANGGKDAQLDAALAEIQK